MTMNQTAIRLFYSDGSPYARICRMVLREAQIIDQVQECSTTLRDPDAVVLPFNPAGRVPALVLADGTTITETTLILLWLDRNLASHKMLPKTDAGLAAYGRALGLLDGVAVWNRELRRPKNERSPGVLELEVQRANRIADALEQDVTAGAYENLDAAQLALLAVLGYAERRHTAWKWRKERPALESWFEQACQRESFEQTLPPLSGLPR